MRALTLLSIVLLAVSGCDPKPEAPGGSSEAATAKAPEAKAAPEAAKPAVQSIVVYSGRGAVLVEPLFEAFTKKTGIEVKVRYGKSTGDLAQQLATEAGATQADVFFAQDSGYIGALGKAGHLATLPTDVLETVPASYRGGDGRWVATSGRLRVLVYNPDKVKPEDLPKTLAELNGPRWKGRLGWAPTNASYQAHVSALRHLWGEEKTKAWLAGIKGLEAGIYPKNSPQVKAASSGEIEVGWVNHYYLHKLKASDPTLGAANYSFPTKDAGNLLMLSGIAVVEHSKKKEAAIELVKFLLSEESQNHFAQKVYEYPTRPGIATHADVPAIGDRVVEVDQVHLTDVSGTLALLRDVGLL